MTQTARPGARRWCRQTGRAGGDPRDAVVRSPIAAAARHGVSGRRVPPAGSTTRAPAQALARLAVPAGRLALAAWAGWPPRLDLRTAAPPATRAVDLEVRITVGAVPAARLHGLLAHGHAATRVERVRRGFALPDPTGSGLWHGRRSRWREAHAGLPCRLCAIGWLSTESRRFRLPCRLLAGPRRA